MTDFRAIKGATALIEASKQIEAAARMIEIARENISRDDEKRLDAICMLDLIDIGFSRSIHALADFIRQREMSN